MGKVRLSKNQLRRQKAKRQKVSNVKEDKELPTDSRDAANTEENTTLDPKSSDGAKDATAPDKTTTNSKLDIEVPEDLLEQYKEVLEKFGVGGGDKAKSDSDIDNNKISTSEEVRDDVSDEQNDTGESDFSEYELAIPDEPEDKPSQDTRKRNKVPMAHLKAKAKYPNIVEWTDADAQDPYLLIAIKQNPNVVPVPSHWSSKRDYLSGKRGIERPPFQLPQYILDTGIQDMRNSVEGLSIRQQQRERVQPKLGKLDIDYQKLHDAFFKYQSRPRLFEFGDVYYEGRENTDENQDKLTDLKPGKISKELFNALGFPEDGNTAPSWISTMLQIGKPPAYSHLIIPGIDIKYANVGYLSNEEEIYGQDSNVENWGEVEDQEESSSDEDDSEDLGDNDEDADDLVNSVAHSKDGEIIPLGQSDDEKDIEDEIVINASKQNSKDKSLYTVLKDSKTKGGDDNLMGPGKKYELNNQEIKETTADKLSKPKSKPERDFKF